jgi:hypothetical protein
MIPTNLDEAIQLVIDELLKDDENINNILNLSEEDFTVNAHHSYGQYLRNNWGLWTKDSPMVKWFINKGIYHADDMSSIILTSFYRKVHSKDIELENQIKQYRDYWEEVDPRVNLGKF